MVQRYYKLSQKRADTLTICLLKTTQTNTL